jgi:hypothetical protein
VNTVLPTHVDDGREQMFEQKPHLASDRKHLEVGLQGVDKAVLP